MTLVARYNEQRKLRDCVSSGKAELIAVYGRRRVGKTFLIREFFQNRFDFQMTGTQGGDLREHLRNFSEQLLRCSKVRRPRPSSWQEAFNQLQDHLASLKKDRVIVFFDELPWLSSRNSRFLSAFDYFWNSWGAHQKNLKIVVCGSATTWMVSHLFHNRGGLYNRVTARIKLSPFTLGEVEQYLAEVKDIHWERPQIVECYMALGGVPFYLDCLRAELSPAQNIDSLFFAEDAPLREEFAFLFQSLFREHSLCQRIVEALSRKACGMSRKALQEALRLEDSGNLTIALNDLILSDFIRDFQGFDKKQRDKLYQLTDTLSLFHLKCVVPVDRYDIHHWTNGIGSAKHNAWAGHAFEQVCLKHIAQIKKALGISGVASEISSWFVLGDRQRQGAQIDLVIDRKDGLIDLCEMKYASEPFEVTKAYAESLRLRESLFKENTKTRKTIQQILVTTFEPKQTPHVFVFRNHLTLDALFEPA